MICEGDMIMDLILEVLFEIIIEGSLELVSHKKVPLISRIIAGIIVLAVYGGLIGLFFFFGIQNSQPILIVIGIIILLITIFAIKKKIKERRIR